MPIDIAAFADASVQELFRTIQPPPRPEVPPRFTPDQFQARVVNSEASLLRVLAPAGSGKTASLVSRAARLARTSAAARILMLTFTNAGVSAFERQLDEELSGASHIRSRIVPRTLNSYGSQLLGPRARKPHDPNWFALANLLPPLCRAKLDATIEDGDLRLARRVWNALDLTKQLGFSPTDSGSDGGVLTLLGPTKALRLLALKLRESGLPLRTWDPEEIRTVWIPFWRELVAATEHSYFTFEDQKFRPFWYLQQRDRAVTAAAVAGAFSHVFIDEFQDVNLLELLLVCELTKLSNATLCMAGDDDQCIYEFKGCSPQFIIRPEFYVPRLLGRPTERIETVILERNYRCPPNITDYSSALIGHNLDRVKKRIEAHRHEKNPDAFVRVVQMSASIVGMHTTVALCRAVIASVEDENDAAEAKREQPLFGLLARRNSQLIPLQILLTKERIPYYIPAGKNLFLGTAYAGLEAAFHLRAHAHPELRACIPARDLQSISACVTELAANYGKYSFTQRKRDTLLAHLIGKTTTEAAIAAIASCSIGSESFRAGIQASLSKLLRAESTLTVLNTLFGEFGGLAKNYEMDKDDIFNKEPPFGLFIDLAVSYATEGEFVRDLVRASQDARAMSEDRALREHEIHLLTAHAAKGLQFNTVIVLDANDGFWPAKQAASEERMEEERRLFYVALTRARSNLLFFCSDHVQDQRYTVSPFLKEAGVKESEYLSNRLPADVLKELLRLYPVRKYGKRKAG
jgi:DNA helicase-2/ATP-dependent DNA helicase PcrA